MVHVLYPDEFDDPRTETQLEDERVEVARQAEHFHELRAVPGLARAQTVQLQARRAKADPVQLESVGPDGGPPFVAALQFLVDGGIDVAQRRLAESFGLGVAPGRAAAGKVLLTPSRGGGDVRSRARGRATGDRTVDIAADLRRQGLGVALNYVVPLGVVMKGPGGPEPTVPLAPRPVGGPAGARIAVLDTGVTDERRSDGYLVGLAGADNVDPLDVFAPHNRLDAGAGHGTFAAGIVQRVFPDADLQVVKVSDSDGITTVDLLAAAMVAAVEDGARILSLSLGTTTLDDEPPPALLDAVQRIAQIAPDAVVVAAAGNGGDRVPVWPGAFAAHEGVDNVVAVAGLDPRGEPSLWSTRGDWVTCSAIGEGVVSTYVIGTEDGDLTRDLDPDTFGPDSWATWTGTSFATPQVAAAIARLGHEQGLSPRAARDALLAMGKDEDVVPDWGRTFRILGGT